MPEELDLPHQLLSRLAMVATLSALKAGDILRKGFGSPMQCEEKEGRHNLVTEWDKKAELAIIEFIKSYFPGHGFLAEESGTTNGNKGEIIWIIDPLDGTVNFAHNIPFFSVSIAASFQNEILAGVVYNPLSNELFIAEKNNGAYLNGNRLHVTDINILDKAIAATGFPYNAEKNPLSCLDLFTHFVGMGMPIRRLGSAALDLAYVAAGRFDVFWEVSLHPWDYAAGKLLIEEAGGQFTHFSGDPYTILEEGSVVATNKQIHEQVLTNIKHKIKC